MHLPGCFLLTRLFQGHPFYDTPWCRSKVFHAFPPQLPLQSVYCVLQVNLFFSIIWSYGGIIVYFTKQSHLKKKDEPCFCPNFIIPSRLHVRRHGWAHLKCWPATFLSTVIPFFIAHSPTSGNEDCTIRQDGVYPTLFSGCQGTLSFQCFGQELTSGL